MNNDLIVDDEKLLGQYIPIHYHYQMLDDEARMTGFKSAIDFLVPSGGTVLELGAGTGILSFFAAQKAARVYGVERQPELVARARSLLVENGCGDKVEIVLGNAMTYLPPEPVDVVICEMLHSALLREKQLEIIQSFKKRYREKFGDKMPVFIPEATILAVEPIYADYAFQEYQAPITLFESPVAPSPRFLSRGTAITYEVVEYQSDFPTSFRFEGVITIGEEGCFNALRFITKNILAINLKEESTIDWLNQNLILPIKQPIDANVGDQFRVSFDYGSGVEIPKLENSVLVARL
ncbi:MAG: methyltransferase domain-containing protein [Ectothiorhodospiraceae bacterium]|nr:methyltransferase domain-containing protein [Ectothiorhodospiraceae bacterium]